MWRHPDAESVRPGQTVLTAIEPMLSGLRRLGACVPVVPQGRTYTRPVASPPYPMWYGGEPAGSAFGFTSWQSAGPGGT